MAVSERAGKPAEAAMLVDVDRLIDAYYDIHPDPNVPTQAVAFGTSGHRGSSLNGSLNEDHILATTEAICRYRKGRTRYKGDSRRGVNGGENERPPETQTFYPVPEVHQARRNAAVARERPKQCDGSQESGRFGKTSDGWPGARLPCPHPPTSLPFFALAGRRVTRSQSPVWL